MRLNLGTAFTIWTTALQHHFHDLSAAFSRAILVLLGYTFGHAVFFLGMVSDWTTATGESQIYRENDDLQQIIGIKRKGLRHVRTAR